MIVVPVVQTIAGRKRESRKAGFQVAIEHQDQPFRIRNRSGRKSTEFTTVKIALFAPIPKASASTDTAAKPGLRRNVLQP